MRTYSLAALELVGALLSFGCTSDNPEGGGMAGIGGAPNAGASSVPGGTMNLGGMPSGGMMNPGGMMNLGGMPSGGMMNLGGMPSGGMMNPGGMSSGGTAMGRMFKIRIENVSASSALPTPFAPGSYALVRGAMRPYAHDVVPTIGLERAAEDGNPSTLALEVPGLPGVSESGIFDVPVGSSIAGPIRSGEAYEFMFRGAPGDRLDFASMLGQSNDTFATTPAGIELFDAAGNPRSGDVTSSVWLWDSGSERTEAPGMGPNQAPRQAAANTGPSEEGVSLWSDGTRALPIPAALVSVAVERLGGTYTVTLTNGSDQGPLMSPLSPVFYALHAAGYHYFTEGSAASAGVERLAEDGNPSLLVAEANAAGAMASSAGTAAWGPGSAVSLSVMPTSALPRLSLAMMIGQTNDAFVGSRPDGVALLDATGAPRMASDIQSDLSNALATWDAGTEANQTPGVGLNQAPRQSAPNVGAPDPDTTLRLYRDSTNDLAQLSDLVRVTVMPKTGGGFQVTLANQSTDSSFPLKISPVAWALHGSGFAPFTLAAPASAGLEALAEDGNAAALAAEWGTHGMVMGSGVAGTTPTDGGGSVSFDLTPDRDHRYLSLAAMLVPSNDTFLAFGPEGIALLDGSGQPRSESDIAGDVMAALAAHDAGTEANQGGALGPAMAPHQMAPNTGKNEGSGRVRALDGVWPYPAIERLIRVTLTPM